MITVQETTVWPIACLNNQYILSDDRRFMFGSIKAGYVYPELFNKPIGFESSGRTFKVLYRTKDVQIGE